MVRLGLLCLAFGCALQLGGCASASKAGAMSLDVTEATLIGEASPLFGAVAVDGVSGGWDTNPVNPFARSTVTNEGLREALRQTLASHAMLADEDARYVLNAELVKLKRPVTNIINLTTTSTIRYTVIDTESGATVFDETIVSAQTGKLKDALNEIERRQIANEKSVRDNIRQMMERLVSQLGGGGKTVSLG